jgi:hypothetical protein
MKQALTVILAATIFWTITEASAQFGQPNKKPQLSDDQRAAVDQHQDAVDALREQIDQTLASENGDFAALLGNAEPTFQERRDLARLRNELLEQSDAAQATVGEIEALNQQFREDNDQPLPGIRHLDSVVRPERINALRVPVSEKDQETLSTHKEDIRTKHEELNTLLADQNARYAELLAKDKNKLTGEERREYRDLRKQLIADDEAARTLVDGIHEANVTFREANPALGRQFGQRRNSLRRAREDVVAVKVIQNSINEILAEESVAFADLLTQVEAGDASKEVRIEFRDLRLELIETTPGVAELDTGARLLKKRVQHRVRHARHHQGGGAPERPVVPDGAPTDDGDGVDSGE